MPKYLAKSVLTPQGLAAIKAGGAAERLANAKKVAEAVGGSLEAFYFAFGEFDVYAVFDLPDDESALSGSIAAALSGTGRVEITKLFTMEQMDDALTRTHGYRAPGAT